MDGLTREIIQQLSAPFALEEIDFLPKAPSNGRALALAYIDARTVMRRLDEVCPDGWYFDFTLLDPQGKMVKGELTVYGVRRCDAGEADKEDETLKAAVSDALKRSAVHFGIGRYIYHLPQVWAPYDAQKRRFTETPKIDSGAIRRALSLAGYTGPVDLPASRTAEPARPVAPSPFVPAVERSERAPTFAGTAGAVQQPAAKDPGELQMTGTQEACPECKAPAGKHTTACPHFQPKARPGGESRTPAAFR